jgi:hypothetical protein
MKFSALILLLSADISLGQLSSPAAQFATPLPNLSPSTTSMKNSSAQDTEFLRGQLDALHSVHDSLISTVHWALTVVFAVTALLVGYNWYTTGKSAERDKQALRDDLLGLVQQAKAEVTDALRQQLTKETAMEATKIQTAAEASIQKIKTDVADHSQSLKYLSELVDEHFAELQCESIVHEARFWYLSKVPGNEFTQYKKLLEIAAPRKMGSEINTALAALLRLTKTNMTLFSSDIAALTELLDTLTPNYASHVNALKEVLADKVPTSRPA